MTLKKGDFITLDFTGKQADNNEVFDTTQEAVAKEHGIKEQHINYEPITICIGEGHVLPGLDNALEGKKEEENFEVTLKPEEAFGKKRADALKLMPKRVFDKQDITPRPGLEVNIDDRRGTIKNVSGNRIIVDFNHPLSGRELTYEIQTHKKVTDTKKQVQTIVSIALQHEPKVTINEQEATIEFPVELPENIREELTKTVTKLTSIKKLHFKKTNKDK